MSPEQLLAEAQRSGISSLALTDINNTSGILDFFRLAKQYNVKPVAGIDFRNSSSQKFIGIAKNNEGFHELNSLLTKHLHAAEPFIDRVPSFENAFIIYPFSTVPHQLNENEYLGINPRDLFKLQFSPIKHRPDKLVALIPVTFRNKTDFNSHRLLRAIDKNSLLSKLDLQEQAQPDEIMQTVNELNFIYKGYPQLLYNTKKMLEQCNVDFDFGKNKNRKYFTGNEKEDHELLLQLCIENLVYRYPNADEKVAERFEKEINVVTAQGFTSYFLINWDIVQYAQSKNYFYVGRGSGANSLVAYLLRITDVDPIDLDLYFERFINPSRTNPPDFDIDFSWNDRDDVIEYIFNRSPYGKKYKDTVALLATYSTFQWDATVRELGKVFGLPKAEIDTFFDTPDKKTDHISRLILNYGKRLIDIPNHLSIHAGGILISEKPITYYSALSHPPKGFPLTQFSMLEAEDVGLYKFDILSQRGLGKIKDAVDIIKQNKKTEIDIHAVNKFKEDEGVRENLRSANLMGCFYVESPAMRMLLTKLEAITYLDLVAASSIIRPGVASSGMMREFILRFKGAKPTYETPKPIYDILHDTFGVMVYQEDVIKVACYYAGLTYGEADMLRRGMSGKYRARAEFQKVEKKFFDNCKERGYAETETKEVWRQIESFAGYAFSKGHSASYAVESYQCMYLKTYFPLEYMTACINNGGGFYATEFYVHEARMCGASIQAPHINQSELLTSIDETAIYLGFHLVSGLEKKTVEIILEERKKNGAYRSFENFMNRVSISIDQLRLLIRANAFRFTTRTKQQLLWDIHSVIGSEKKTRVETGLFEPGQKIFQLPELYYNKIDDVWDEIEILGFPLCSPFELLASPLTPPQNRGEVPIANNNSYVNSASDLIHNLGKIISIVGYLVTRKSTRTKKGDAMAFGTFLDREGRWIDTTHFPDVLKRFPFYLKGCYLITGKVVEEFGFYSLDVVEMKRLENISKGDADKKEVKQ